ncbi:Pecanex-like protein 4 [Irineochytrium annulatum]|nr:Pecanex-like protein 4 [Irineochytrium annulatum]
MARPARMSSPLVNTYRLPFILRRLFETFFGGPRLPPSGARPATVLLALGIQTVIFWLPYAVVQITLVVCDRVSATGIAKAAASGVAVALLLLGVLVARSPRVDRDAGKVGSDSGDDVVADEDEELDMIETGLPWSLVKWIMPPIRLAHIAPPGGAAKGKNTDQNAEEKDSRRRAGFPPAIARAMRVMFRILVGGVMCGGAAVYLAFERLEGRYVGWQAVHVFGWVAVGNAMWSLMVGRPAEPNTYHPDDVYGVDDFTRPVYVGFILSFGAMEPNVTGITFVNDILIIILCVFPLLWFLGICPSLRVLVLFLMETVSLHLFLYIAENFQ